MAGRSRASKSTVGDAPVEADRLVGQGQGQGDGDVGVDDAELAGGDGDAGLAAAVDGVDGGGLGGRADGDAEVDVAQVAGGAGELELGGVVAQGLGGVEELGAGGVAAGAAVVVGRVPVGQADEQHGVDGFGDVGVAEPDRLAPFLAPGPQPVGELVAGCRASSTMTVSMKLCLPAGTAARRTWGR